MKLEIREAFFKDASKKGATLKKELDVLLEDVFFGPWGKNDEQELDMMIPYTCFGNKERLFKVGIEHMGKKESDFSHKAKMRVMDEIYHHMKQNSMHVVLTKTEEGIRLFQEIVNSEGRKPIMKGALEIFVPKAKAEIFKGMAFAFADIVDDTLINGSASKDRAVASGILFSWSEFILGFNHYMNHDTKHIQVETERQGKYNGKRPVPQKQMPKNRTYLRRTVKHYPQVVDKSVDKPSDIKDTATNDTRKHIITKDVWEVSGHTRTYKSGKVVFIKPFRKGKRRKDSLAEKVYIANKYDLEENT